MPFKRGATIDRIAELLERAERAAAEGRFNQANRLVLNALYLDETRAAAWALRARLAHDSRGAREAWEQAVVLDPDYARLTPPLAGSLHGSANTLIHSVYSPDKTGTHKKLASAAAFITQRLGFGLLVLLSIIFLSYLGLDMANGRGFYPALGQAGESTVTYLGRLLHGELGLSSAGSITRRPIPVSEVLSNTLPRSLGLLAAALLIATVLGVSLGVLAATRRNSRGSLAFLITSIAGMSIPSFFAALLLQLIVLRLMGFFGRSILPVGGFGWDAHIVLPALVIAARPIAQIARITFVKVSEILEEDFVRTAYSKGLATCQVLFGHAMRNAAIPILTTVAVSLRFSLSSLPVVEFFFGWPGVGFTLLKAIGRQDDNTTIPLLLCLGLLFIFVNLILELSYRFIDPRLRMPSQALRRERGWTNPVVWFKSCWTGLKELLTDNRITRYLAQRKVAPIPTRIHMVRHEEDQDIHLADSISKRRRNRVWLRDYLYNVPFMVGAILVVLLLVVVVFGPRLAPHSPYTTHGLEKVDGKYMVPPFAPSATYPLGSDPLGRDIMSLILTGAQQTLLLAALVVAARILVGLILGAIAGWLHGSFIDRLLLRIAEIIAAFPMLLLAMMLILAIGIRQGFRPFVIALCFVGWGEIMQFVRSEVLTLRSKPFVESARAVAVRTPRIITTHILPHMIPALIPIIALEMGAVLMLLGELGFIGIFIGGGAFAELSFVGSPYHYSDVPEWGALLSSIRLYARSYPWVALYPSLAFFVFALGFNLFGEGLRRLAEKGKLRLRFLVNRYTIALALVAVLVTPFIQWNTGSMAFYHRQASAFDSERAISHVEALTDPSFEGRALGSTGMEAAADYIAQQFQTLGLQAAGRDYSYFDTHSRSYESLDAVPKFAIEDGGPDPLYLYDYTEYAGEYRNLGEIRGNIRFFATGELACNAIGAFSALDKLDFSDQILLVPFARDAFYLDEASIPIGGILIIADDALNIERHATLSFQNPNFSLHWDGNDGISWDDHPELWVSTATATRLLAGTGKPLAELCYQAVKLERNEFVDVTTKMKASMEVRGTIHIDAPVRHVIGYIPGTMGGEALGRMGLSLDDQMIVVMAQYDSPPLGPEEASCAAANDNASGVAVMLEAIRVIQETGYQPYKTFLFVAYSGEGWENGHTVFAPDASEFLNAARNFSWAYDIEAVVRLRGLGAGDGTGLALSAGGNLRLANVFRDAARRMGVKARSVEDVMDISIVFEEKSFSEGGQEAPDITLSWDGWEETSRRSADTFANISEDKLKRAGRTLALALMILGRETNY